MNKIVPYSGYGEYKLSMTLDEVKQKLNNDRMIS